MMKFDRRGGIRRRWGEIEGKKYGNKIVTLGFSQCDNKVGMWMMLGRHWAGGKLGKEQF